MDNYIIWIREHSDYFGSELTIHYKNLIAKVGAVNSENLSAITMAINKKNPKLVDSTKNTLSLTDAGWQWYDDIMHPVIEGKKAFMAMKFDDDDMQNIYLNHFKPATEELGFDLGTLDENPKAGILDIHMEEKIASSQFMIADLTHNNRGVYWEAGLATGLKIPVIYTCRIDKTKAIHFDTNHRRFVKWDPENLDKAIKQIKMIIINTFELDTKMED